jgi:site-specific recombinase XerD
MFLAKHHKSPYYQIVYFVDGKRNSVSTKTKIKSEAIKFLIDFQNSSEDNPKENIIQQEGTASITLSQFKQEYIAYLIPTKSPKYISSIKYSFNQFISFVGAIELVKTDKRLIDKFIISSFSKTQRGAHLFYRTLKAAFNKAIEWNYIESNPFTKVKFPKLVKSFPTFISEDELLIILSNTPYQYLKDIFTVGFYTGLRLGELINMRWNWIDFFNNQITVKCSDDFLTKSKKERIIPMSEKVKSILITRFNLGVHQPGEVVFFRIQKRKLHQETISKQFKEVVRYSNLNERIHFHSLRHSFASLLAQKGVSLYIIKELLGHEDLATTQIYSHLQQQNLRDAVNLL